MPDHELYARPKSDKTAKPFKLFVSGHVGDAAAAKEHATRVNPLLEVVDAPADAGKAAGPMNQAVGPDGKPPAADPPKDTAQAR